MTSERKPALLSDEAMEWLVLVREHPDDPSIREAFEAWLEESAAHRREWERTCSMWQMMEHVPADSPQQRFTATRGHKHGRGRTGSIRIIIAASLLLCLGILAGPSLLLQWKADYRTQTAMGQDITLEDGSVVHLSADSAIALAFSERQRGVTLLKGEAFFNVTPDSQRPFTVESGELKVEVLGTAFDLRLGGGDIEVSLAHGSVKATAEMAGRDMEQVLSPGERLTLDRSTGRMVTAPVAVEDIASWRDGRLYVVDQTIGSVIEQIQRYHPAIITIPDTALARQRVSGIYDLNSPDKALGALVDPYGGKVRKLTGHIRVISRL